jgi:aromatic ring-cleaving dioxygenase
MVDEDFHAHIYFSEDTRASAMELRSYLAQNDVFEVDLQPVRDAPIGPHPSPMFNAHMDKAGFGRAMHWLMLHHGEHSVLIHPQTDDAVADHTKHALWLGERLELNLGNL